MKIKAAEMNMTLNNTLKIKNETNTHTFVIIITIKYLVNAQHVFLNRDIDTGHVLCMR